MQEETCPGNTAASRVSAGKADIYRAVQGTQQSGWKRHENSGNADLPNTDDRSGHQKDGMGFVGFVSGGKVQRKG
jgi:hypothetical protein